MTYLKLGGRFALTAALFAATTAQADISAEEVWQGWTSYYTDMGQTVSYGTKTMQGNTLVISDAVIAATLPDGTFNLTIAELRLRETGDGRVEVTMSGDIPLRMLSKPVSGEEVDLGMKFTQSGLVTTVSGTVTDTSYDFSADRLAMVIDRMTVDSAAVPLALNISMAGAKGTYHMISDGSHKVTSDMKADSLDFSMSAQNPEGTGKFDLSGQMQGLAGTSIASLPSGMDMRDMNAVLQAGMNVTGTFGYASGGYTMNFEDGAETVAVVTSGQDGSLSFAMSKDGLAYGGNAGANEISVKASAFPVPVDISSAGMAFSMAIPVSKSAADQPFSVLLKLIDLKVSDGLWNMFDPGSQLPRDPATLIVDVKGSAKLDLDVMDPANAQALDRQPPGELSSLDVSELKLSAAGAELTGTGAVTFNNAGPVPQPIGSVDLQLIGGNGLIDKLVAMGFVPEDQATGTRMMMGLFAVMTGDDTLTSKIEFKEDGAVYANGQRVQ